MRVSCLVCELILRRPKALCSEYIIMPQGGMGIYEGICKGLKNPADLCIQPLAAYERSTLALSTLHTRLPRLRATSKATSAMRAISGSE